MRTCARILGLTALLTLSALPLLGATVFVDPFDGTALDPVQWTIVDGAPGIWIGAGSLTLTGGPDHKRVTIAQFPPPAGDG